MTIFDDAGDYEAFERVLVEAVERTRTRLLEYCVPNHWHLVVWPREDGELSRFTGWLTLTHTQRWHAHRHITGPSPYFSPADWRFTERRGGRSLQKCGHCCHA